MYTQIQPFPATEGIALGKTDNALGTVSAACLSFSIRLYIEVVRLVEQAVHLHVQDMARIRGVTRGEREVRRGVQSAGSQLPLALFMQPVIIQGTGPHLQVVGDGTHTERHVRPVVVDDDVTETPLFLQLLHKLTLQVDGYRTDRPLPQGTGTHRVGHLQANGCLAMDEGRICKIAGVAVLIVIITVAAEQFRNPFTLLLECRHIKGISLVENRLVEVSRYQTVGRRREIGIPYAVKRPQMSHIDRITQPPFLRIALCNPLIADFSVKIAALLQQVLTHGDTQVRRSGTHQHRCRAESLHHPAAEAGGVRRKGIPYPETHRERRPYMRAAQQGSIGQGCQDHVKFFLHGNEMLVTLVAAVSCRLHAGVQLLAAGNGGGSAAAGQVHQDNQP